MVQKPAYCAEYDCQALPIYTSVVAQNRQARGLLRQPLVRNRPQWRFRMCWRAVNEYDTFDQTFGVFADVLAYPWLGCVLPDTRTIIYETDRAAAAWPREEIVTPGMVWNDDDRTFDTDVGRPGMRVVEPWFTSVHG